MPPNNNQERDQEMQKPRIRIKPLGAGLWSLKPKSWQHLPVIVPASALRDLAAYAEMLETINAPLTLRNLRDCLIVA